MEAKKNHEYLIVNTGERVSTLKGVRKILNISGRAIKYAFEDGRLKKISINQNVPNDEERKTGIQKQD